MALAGHAATQDSHPTRLRERGKQRSFLTCTAIAIAPPELGLIQGQMPDNSSLLWAYVKSYRFIKKTALIYIKVR